MKNFKQFVFFVSFILAITVTITTVTTVSVPKKLRTWEVDEVYLKSSFIVNDLEKEKQVINFDEDCRLHFFIGKAGVCTINMCTVQMPKMMDSQVLSVQIVVNGHQQFMVPQKLKLQVYDNPKFIKGKFVIRARVGMFANNGEHFYVVIDPDGNGYSTNVE